MRGYSYSLSGFYARLSAAGILALVLLGCGVIQHSYVDPDLPKVPLSSLARPEPRKSVRLSFEFQTNGKHQKGLSGRLSKTAQEKLDSTGVVRILDESSSSLPELSIVMNNVADVADAAGKGFVAGLTWGMAGQVITDHYEFSVTYQPPAGPSLTRSYKHAIHTTQGIKEGPPGLEPMTLNQAFDKVLEELLFVALRDLQEAGAFAGAEISELKAQSPGPSEAPAPKPSHILHRLLIVPFEDAPGMSGSGNITTDAFVAAFLEVGRDRYEIVGPGLLEKALLAGGKSLRDCVATDVQDEMASHFGADAVVTGAVTTWKKGSMLAQPKVGITAKCRSVDSGSILWTLSHTDEVWFAQLPKRNPEYAVPKICATALKESDIPGLAVK